MIIQKSAAQSFLNYNYVHWAYLNVCCLILCGSFLFWADVCVLIFFDYIFSNFRLDHFRLIIFTSFFRVSHVFSDKRRTLLIFIFFCEVWTWMPALGLRGCAIFLRSSRNWSTETTEYCFLLMIQTSLIYFFFFFFSHSFSSDVCSFSFF